MYPVPKAKAVVVKILEKHVLKAILDFCAANRVAAYRRNVMAVKIGKRFIRANKPGMADIWGVCRGVTFECEVKAPGKKPTLAQEQWLELMRGAGAVAFWCDSLDGFVSEMQKGGLL